MPPESTSTNPASCGGSGSGTYRTCRAAGAALAAGAGHDVRNGDAGGPKRVACVALRHLDELVLFEQAVRSSRPAVSVTR